MVLFCVSGCFSVVYFSGANQYICPLPLRVIIEEGVAAKQPAAIEETSPVPGAAAFDPVIAAENDASNANHQTMHNGNLGRGLCIYALPVLLWLFQI